MLAPKAAPYELEIGTGGLMGHDHSHDHANAPDAIGKAFAIGAALNVTFVLVESIFGVLAHSTALLADAAHNASDFVGLLFAWGATAMARSKPSARKTYGLRRSTILAALTNAVLLLVAVGGVAWEAIGQLRDPAPVEGKTVIIVAAFGVAINTISALLLMKGGKRDANVQGAFLHLAADAAVSFAVVIAGVVIWGTGLRWIDPLTSLVVSMIVLAGTWGLLRDATGLVLDAVPNHIDPEAVRAHLAALPNVEEVHDLHIWALSTTETALTAHLAMQWTPCPPPFLTTLAEDLRKRFEIHHVTVQIEPIEAREHCAAVETGAV